MTTAQRAAAGMAMLGLGALILLIAALLSWSAVQRWLAVSETHQAVDQLRLGRAADARRVAASAAERLPDELAPAVLAVDPADLAALDRLARQAASCPRPADRQAATAAVGLMRLAAGKPADVQLDGTADGRLLAAIAAARAGRTPGPLTATDEDPPHRNVLRAAHLALLRYAWQRGELAPACVQAGALLLLQPTAPEAPALQFLLAAASPDKPDPEVIRLGEAIRNDRDAVIRAVATLVASRREALRAKWPKLCEGLP